MLNFEEILIQLRNNSFEEIMKSYNKRKGENAIPIECIKNQVYEDEDLYEFLDEIGAKIIDYNDGYALIRTDNKYYEVPYQEFENRFGDDLPDETILLFDSITRC